MSNTQISGHIPDLDLITYYSENGTSVFTRVSPWTKAVTLVLIVFFVTVIKSLILLSALYITVLAVYWLSGLPVRKLFAWYALPLIFVLSLVLILMWNEPGIPVFSLNIPYMSLTLTNNGIVLVLSLTLKALISVTYSLFFLMTTRYNYFSAMIYRIFPSPIDQIFLMSYRFIFITLSMVDSMIKALRSRGGDIIGSTIRQSRMFAEVFALIFIRSYDRADRINKAMEARGFSGKYIAVTEIPRMGLYDYVFLLISSLTVAYLYCFIRFPF